MVSIKDEWLLAVGTVALIGFLLVSGLSRLYTIGLVAGLLAIDVAFVLVRNRGGGRPE